MTKLDKLIDKVSRAQKSVLTAQERFDAAQRRASKASLAAYQNQWYMKLSGPTPEQRNNAAQKAIRKLYAAKVTLQAARLKLAAAVVERDAEYVFP